MGGKTTNVGAVERTDALHEAVIFPKDQCEVANDEANYTTRKPLLGTESATIDDKGRILIAKKKRDRLGDGFTMCIGENGCIVAFPAWKWDEIVAQIMSFEAINQGRQDYARFMLGSAEDELDFDAQGRVVVPRRLRLKAQLEDQVIIVGCGDRMEIWSGIEFKMYERDPDAYNVKYRETVLKAYKGMKGIE